VYDKLHLRKLLISFLWMGEMHLYKNFCTFKCDRACENRACGHMIFAYFFNISKLITFYSNMLWQWNFQHLVRIYLALWCRLQNENILFQNWDMTFRETGCSLCPHALFSQAWSQIALVLTQIWLFMKNQKTWFSVYTGLLWVLICNVVEIKFTCK